MSRMLSKYEVGRYDTAESISRGYRMSWQAIRDIPANEHLRHRLPDSGKVATGLLLSIPPHAGRLVRERLSALNRLRAQIMAHFDRLDQRAETELMPLLAVTGSPLECAQVQKKMAELAEDALVEVEFLMQSMTALADLCMALAHTHVGTDADRRVNASAGANSGIYWLLPREKVQAWEGLWALANWSDRWSLCDGDAAWGKLDQFSTTIRSIAVQSIDDKIRRDIALERQLINEFRDA